MPDFLDWIVTAPTAVYDWAWNDVLHPLAGFVRDLGAEAIAHPLAVVYAAVVAAAAAGVVSTVIHRTRTTGTRS